MRANGTLTKRIRSLHAACKIFTNRVAQGIAQCERALELDQNLAYAHGSIGLAKYFIGRGVETEAQQALRLSPRDVSAHILMMFAGVAKLWHGADAEAVAWLRRSVEANRNFPLSQFYLAAALAHLGELGEASAAARAGLELHPSFTITATARAPLATILRTSRDASAPMRVCAWLGCQRGNVPDGSQPAAETPGKHVRSAPDSGPAQRSQRLRLGANCRLINRCKQSIESIAS